MSGAVVGAQGLTMSANDDTPENNTRTYLQHWDLWLHEGQIEWVLTCLWRPRALPALPK